MKVVQQLIIHVGAFLLHTATQNQLQRESNPLISLSLDDNITNNNNNNSSSSSQAQTSSSSLSFHACSYFLSKLLAAEGCTWASCLIQVCCIVVIIVSPNPHVAQHEHIESNIRVTLRFPFQPTFKDVVTNKLLVDLFIDSPAKWQKLYAGMW
jgi:hypothetical protein